MIQSKKANHQGGNTNPQGERGAGAWKSHLLFLYYFIFYNILRWMSMVVIDLDPMTLQVLEMKKERRRLFREALDGLDLRFFGSTSSCPSKKSVKPAT